MKKLLIIFFSLSCFMLFINKVNALDLTDVFLIMADDCEYVLGDLNDSDSSQHIETQLLLNDISPFCGGKGTILSCQVMGGTAAGYV